MQQQPTPEPTPALPPPPAAPVLPEGVTLPAGSPAAEMFAQMQAQAQAQAQAQMQAARPSWAPRTARDVAALRARRSELSNQLTSAEGRRERLIREMNRYPEGPARAGIEQRLRLLDQRIIQLETDIAESGRQLVTAPSEALTAEPPRRESRGADRVDFTPIAVTFNLAVLMPIALAYARRVWKRTTAPAPVVRPAASPEDSQRLLRLEQAVDTIAVEVERISEGQRFVTQLLADGTRPGRALETAALSDRHR